MPLRALYVDFNSYFASVEQQLRPELRGRPVGILPVLAETTCCIAASYEAKAFGVKTGTPVWEARKRCRDIVFVEARPAVYVELHQRLVKAVESCTPVGQVLSIDEMACPLMGSEREREKAVALARQIKQTIAREVGEHLRSSIGIAPNTFLAKIASDMQKPDGLTVLEAADLPQALYRLELRDIPGIGRAMESRLWRHGIRTVEQLCAANAAQLRAAWGSIEGERMHARLAGEELPPSDSQRASVGHSHVLPPELRYEASAYSVLNRLLQKAAMRLRSYALVAGEVSVTVRFRQHEETWDWRAAQRLDPTADTRALLHALDVLWRQRPRTRAEPFAVGVTLTQLTSATQRSRDLFTDTEEAERLNTALDAINLRYGKNTIYFGGAHAALAAAPMRIAFQHIPDLTVEAD
ncbi:MAG: DNA polymerase [Rhodocyclaceae bacterium]|nr:DNA polymerase [Rhodocyclaceae bacterium]